MAGRVPVGYRPGAPAPEPVGFKTCRASKPAGPQDLRISEPADFSASGRPRRVLRAGFRAKHARAASSPSGKMPLSFSFRCNSRPIPMYIPELRCIPAYSGTPVIPVAIRRIRPYSGSSGLIPGFRCSGCNSVYLGRNSAYSGRIPAASAVCFSQLRRTSPDGPRWPRAGCWPPTRLRCGRGRSSATPCRESPRQSCSRARRPRACGRLRLP